MLTFMRSRFKTLKWLLWGIVASFIITIFVGWGMGSRFGGREGTGNAVALVDGRQITREEFLRALKNLEDNYREMLKENYDQRFRDMLKPRQRTLDDLIERKLALGEAHRLGLDASPSEVSKHLLRTFVDEKGAFLGEAEVKARLSRVPLTLADYEAFVAEDITYDKLRTAIESTAVVPEQEVRDEYMKRNDTLGADYVVLDPATLGPTAAPSEAEIKKWYDGHKADYATTKRKARIAAVASATYAGQVTVEDKEVRERYDADTKFGRFAEKRRARHILIRTDPTPGADEGPARSKAESLAARVRAGEDFATLARENSADPGSAAQGGDLGFFPRGQMVPEFDQAVFAAQVGDVVGPVKTNFGYHVIKLEEVKAPASYDEAAVTLKKEMAESKAHELAKKAAEALIAAAGTQGLEAAAKAQGLSSAVSELAAKEDQTLSGAGLPPGLPAPSVIAALFAVAKKGELSPTPLPFPGGSVAIALEEETASLERALAEVHDKVLADLKQARGTESAAAAAKKLQDELAKGATFADAAKLAGVEVKNAAALRAGGMLPGVAGSAEIVTRAFAAKEGQVLGPMSAGSVQVIAKLTKKFTFDEAAYATGKDEIVKSLEQERSRAVWAGMVKRIRHDLEAKGRIRVLQPAMVSDKAATEEAG